MRCGGSGSFVFCFALGFVLSWDVLCVSAFWKVEVRGRKLLCFCLCFGVGVELGCALCFCLCYGFWEVHWISGLGRLLLGGGLRIEVKV